MSKGKRYSNEFKIEAVKQISERGYSVADVAERIGVCTKKLYQWRADLHGSHQQAKANEDQLEIIKLKSELERVTEERDILKKAAKYFASNPE